MAARPPRRLELPIVGRAWIAGVIALVLLAGAVLLAFANERLNAAEQSRRASVQAQILAGSVSAALAFDDRATAQEYLRALKANHDIEAVGIYGADGRLVAGYATAGPRLPPSAAVHDPRIEGGKLTVGVPVAQGGMHLGTVYLRSIVEPWTRRASRYVGIGIIITLAALLIFVLGSSYAVTAQAFRELRHETDARERAEAALRQAQKMEAMGQLTGGVAHDFNNLLMAASSGIELLERTEDPKRRKRLTQGVRDALDRGAKLTQQLLTFARQTPVKSEVLDVGARLQGIRDLLDRSLREDVRVRFHVDPETWPVEVDPAQFDIAVVNLAVNARDAMPNGGRIDIEARNLPGALEGDDAVEICVADQGGGMPPEVLEKVFEPFFTTKGVGRGTGLGLSQVYGFARAAGGYTAIESEPGHGTAVRMILPRCLRDADPRIVPPAAAAPPELDACLLVVEDDDVIADLLKQMLAELGCDVERAATAREGLDKFARKQPDAVISDMVMPGEWSGLDLVREIRKRQPDMPVLLMTGYSSAAAEAQSEGFRLLEKPFNLKSIAVALGEILPDRRSAAPSSTTA